MSSGKTKGGGAANFREAIARWRLDLRTEVKRTSSLPTAMFDACDPMLETRLAETAQAMLARLQGTAPPATATDAAMVEKRLERVTGTDMAKLPRQIAAMADEQLDLEEGLAAEYLGILADACAHASGTAHLGAAHLLARDFALGPDTDIAVLTELLAREVRKAPERFAKAKACTEEAVHLACTRVAEALGRHLGPDAAGGSA